jgi:multimeric flavodoxin WrbA
MADSDDLPFCCSQGLWRACDAHGSVSDIGLCEECGAKPERDLLRKRDWDYSVSAFGWPQEKREELRARVIAEFGKTLELIADETAERKRSKGARKGENREERHDMAAMPAPQIRPRAIGASGAEKGMFMKVIAFNGSPRKKGWNTVTLLENALEGAASAGAQTELVQLYDLRISGCISCFSCKKIGRRKDGVCAIQDDLAPVLERVRNADALIIGTPVYYGAESAATRALIERLCFPYNKYSKDRRSLFPRRIRTALIYTMNVSEELLKTWGYDRHFTITRTTLERHFGTCELLLSTETLQYSDYDKYESEMFDRDAKIRRHAEVFPEDCKRAFNLGVRMVSSA